MKKDADNTVSPHCEFGPTDDLAGYIPDFGFELYDLHRFSDDQIKGTVMSRAMAEQTISRETGEYIMTLAEKLRKKAESHQTMLATYDDLEDTANTVANIIGSGKQCAQDDQSRIFR